MSEVTIVSSDEETVRVVANVPKSIKETAKEKLPHGGLSQEIEDALSRVAFGEDLAQRSRLERQLDELQDERSRLQDERRELNAKIETYDNQIESVQSELSQLSSKEERYESKLEELEDRLRVEGMRLDPGNRHVTRVAKEAQREVEGVIHDLKERNPDVPDFAFEDGLHDHENTWRPIDDDEITPVDERKEVYR
jgi:chromosome segregation ATPase